MFKCPICDKEFSKKHSLSIHTTYVHHTKEVKQPDKIYCKICNKDIGAHAWGRHLSYNHNTSVKDYYDAYIKKPDEGFCINCKKPTTFYSMTRGYAKCCSQLCQRQHIYDNMTKERRIESNLKNSNSVKKYIQNRSKEETSKIMKKIHHSNMENIVIVAINSIYSKDILKSIKSKKFIYPYELDIVLPYINLAIECNGNYWHSNLCKPNDYHLKKSLLCREKGIRLIHIYEFEDLEEQLKLLKDLILGVDNYPKNDFNKNNLIENIPEPEIIYQDTRSSIYGAGKLY